jgi:hypothetical protein
VGTSTAALKAVPLALNGVAALLVWRVGRRLMPPGGAIAAGLVMWLWPANYLWWSIKARGFYEATLCITIACVLLLLRIAAGDDPEYWRDWAVLGLLAGLGWWQTPQVVYVLAPAGLWLVITHPRTLRYAWAAIPGVVVGALPWLIANINSGFSSLNPPSAPIQATYAQHLLTFMRDGLPMTFGLKYVYLTYWIGTRHITELLFALGIAVVVAGCLRRQRESLLLGLVIVAYPLIHALLNLSSEVAEGRYTLFLLPWLVLALARACQRPWAMTALFAVILSLSWVGLRDLRGQTSPYAPDHRVPTSMAPLEHDLESNGITRVWANYWIAYRLTFETREHVIAATSLLVRYRQYNEDVETSPDPAFVFLAASSDVRTFHTYLHAHHIDYTEDIVDGTWVVDVPAKRLDPSRFPSISS